MIHSIHSMILHFLLIALLAWILLFIISVYLWMVHSHRYACSRIEKLITQQKIVLAPIKEQSLLKGGSNKIAFSLSSSTSELSKPVTSKLHLSVLQNKRLIPYVVKTKELLTLLNLVTEHVIIKCIVLVAALPLCFLMSLVGLVDGLSLRAIRTACLGRESAYSVQLLMSMLKKSVLLAFATWLLLPWAIRPDAFFIPLSLGLAFMVAQTTRQFKKYL